MAGFKGKSGKRSVRTKVFIFQQLLQAPLGLTTEQIFDAVKKDPIGRYVGSPSQLSQIIRTTKGVSKLDDTNLSKGGGVSYSVAVWTITRPSEFFAWYGSDEI